MRVLLVDDEIDFVTTLSNRLGMRGIKTDVVHDGEAALAALPEEERLAVRRSAEALTGRVRDTTGSYDLAWVAFIGALALAVAGLLIRDGKIDHDFIEQHVHGFPEFAELASTYTPERASDITDVPAGYIYGIADAIGAAETILRSDPENERAMRIRYNAALALGEYAGILQVADATPSATCYTCYVGLTI